MTRENEQWSFNYLDLANATGLTYDAVRQHKSRKNFDPGNIRSLFIWAARHGDEELKKEMLRYMLCPDLDLHKTSERNGAKAKRKTAKKKKPD